MNNEEDILQKQCEEYLKLKRIKYIHLPKGMQRFIWSKKYGVPARVGIEASKALKGVPDLIIFAKDGRCLLVELKSEKGRLTPEQEEWLVYGLQVFRDFESFRKRIDRWQKFNEEYIIAEDSEFQKIVKSAYNTAVLFGDKSNAEVLIKNLEQFLNKSANSGGATQEKV